MYLYTTEPQYNDVYPYDFSGLQAPWYYNTNFICPLYRYNSQRNDSELRLSNKIHELWEQHTVWTRATIVSLVFGLLDVNFITNRLLQNPEAFGNG